MKLKPVRSTLKPLLNSWYAPVGLTILVLFYVFGSIPYQNVLRSYSFDIYQLVMPREKISSPVVIVDIDEASLNQYGQWPWPRSLMAKLLDNITAMEPAAVAVDIIMPEPDRYSPCHLVKHIVDVEQKLIREVCGLPGNDEILAAALERGKYVLGIAGREEGAEVPVNSVPMRAIGGDPRAFIRYFPTALLNVPVLEKAASGHAILNADIERGVVRKMPLVASVGDTVLPSLPLEILRLAVGSPFFSVKTTEDRVEAVGVEDLFIPTQANGSIWVNYGHHDPSRFISAAQILDNAIEPDLLSQKLVLVGFSGLGLVDFPSTTLGERVPGVEIHAQVLESIFDGTTLLRPYWASWLEGTIMMVLGFLILWGFQRIKAWAQIPVVITINTLLALTGLLLFHYSYILIDVASPILLFIILYFALLADSLMREEAQIEELEDDLRLQREAAAKVQGEMEAAKRFQMGIVPEAESTFIDEPRLDIAARMEPAKMVGGDLYDFFMLDEHRVFFSLGDVCGKGVPASLFMVISKTLCKSVLLREESRDIDLGLLLSMANKEISRDNPEMLFVTAFVGVLDLRSGLLNYCNAGHEKPMLVAEGCETIELPGASGPPVSIVDEWEYKTHTYQLSSEEFLCIFSDGITEAINHSQELFGRERLIETLSKIDTSNNAEEVMEQTCESVYSFVAGAEPSDDLTILVVRWRGSREQRTENRVND